MSIIDMDKLDDILLLLTLLFTTVLVWLVFLSCGDGDGDDDVVVEEERRKRSNCRWYLTVHERILDNRCAIDEENNAEDAPDETIDRRQYRPRWRYLKTVECQVDDGMRSADASPTKSDSTVGYQSKYNSAKYYNRRSASLTTDAVSLLHRSISWLRDCVIKPHKRQEQQQRQQLKPTTTKESPRATVDAPSTTAADSVSRLLRRCLEASTAATARGADLVMSYVALAVAEKMLQLPWMTFVEGESNETFRWMLNIGDEIGEERNDLPRPITTATTSNVGSSTSGLAFRRRGDVAYLITLERTTNVLNKVDDGISEVMAMTVEQGTQTENSETDRHGKNDVLTESDVVSGNATTENSRQMSPLSV